MKWIALAAAWISTVILTAATVLGMQYMNVTLKPNIKVRVDTVRSVKYDTVTVISRAADTVRITTTNVGPLTEARLVSLICGKKYDAKDVFDTNPALGFVICSNHRSVE
jgi:hypothetical protein